MNTDINTLKSELLEFLDLIPFDAIAQQVAASTGKPAGEISSLLDTYANESLVSLDLVIERLDSAERILEVGAGLCLLSLFLKQQGYPIIALEPALGGYGIFDQTKDAIREHFSTLQLEVLTVPAQELTREKYGSFDLIFSNNVMEHIPDWQSAIHAMASVLSENGKMVHSCPNYTIPYEPHYGIPVFRHFRALSQRLFLPETSDTDIWNSLNFITCFNVRKFCKERKLCYGFEKGLLYKAFKRVDDDPVFKERHKGLIVYVAQIMMKTPFKQLVRNIPASLSTPMIFEISCLPEQKD
ncbi:bifunctional 3-demethylubiquinone-9 3-methyltransferase/ 2-octaprenyl-6-hydroxy phenol methylase [Mariprofundus micogutta]|uniref:Bifunctional 3-demethylubiquinone-9 3-methyltransferase/ 2-octaprenyl-6-hydroxy phenol methylase n=1 Tax=Mariprofundus micogutta TaxID=1921010 RepID=A0A1L8CN29_9PROT|nr:class I SAM-dependent methyltransferase [Mariprofundus micogutta]GAV20304.1 bifunctional 3-demethylubiquinone-9 3-methyltransferase/ 2-octaprenyl-6-hydroxy phenol methylase [Mariprofundus micogutta]